ncbi:NHL repeat-containing protein [Paraburkholderia acidicola]|uniref:NHL repeat-containing protein n=1 Tax=Paraburkholderia acidicola TaxID=1912599 RepID=A0ABV1LIF8_9BURK
MKMFPLSPLAAAALCVVLAACGGGSNSPGTSSSTSSPPPVTSTASPPVSPWPGFTVSGTVAGLSSGETLTLLDNGSDSLTLTGNGAFTFAALVPANIKAGYGVTVGSVSPTIYCSINNGSGSVTANVTNVAVICAPATYSVTTFAGSLASGATDGTGSAALFNGPAAVTADATGNVYVADSNNNTIRKITPAGVVTTLAGSATAGSTNGTGAAASFNGPFGVAVDASGNVYVTDSNNNEIRKITPAGVVTTLAGSGAAGSADGTGAAASFSNPNGVAVDASGNVYVADSGNNKIRKITQAGVVTTLAGAGAAGSADGSGAAASFSFPGGVALDGAGNLYVADTSNNEIRKITPAGVVTTLAGSAASGSTDSTGSAASFNGPFGVSVDASSNIYVADSNNNVIRKITPAGVVTTLAGSTKSGSANGIGGAVSFNDPLGVAVDTSGNLYAADIANNEIRKLTPPAP